MVKILGLPEQVEKNKQDIEEIKVNETELEIRVSNNETNIGINQEGILLNQNNITTNQTNIETNTEAIEAIGVDWFISSDGTEPTLPTAPTDLVDAKKGDAAYDITVGPIISQGYRLIDNDPTVLANWIPFDASGNVDLSDYYNKTEVDQFINPLNDKTQNLDSSGEVPNKPTTDNQISNKIYVDDKLVPEVIFSIAAAQTTFIPVTDITNFNTDIRDKYYKIEVVFERLISGGSSNNFGTYPPTYIYLESDFDYIANAPENKQLLFNLTGASNLSTSRMFDIFVYDILTNEVKMTNGNFTPTASYEIHLKGYKR